MGNKSIANCNGLYGGKEFKNLGKFGITFKGVGLMFMLTQPLYNLSHWHDDWYKSKRILT